MTTNRIAIIGIGLRYPDAASTGELWDNVLAGRRAFRQLPDQRMKLADYYSPDPTAPDRFYATKAAVLRDFEFDRVKYQVAGSTYRSTDLTHWLALDVAAAALADAGFPDAAGLPRRTTGVMLGNSLTGEFSRANLMRVRWPYVRRTLATALTAKGWAENETQDFLRDLEPVYKAPFPPVDEDTLAGGLSNTIAGRICNYFDLAGGGYTVDGACSSSLLAITSAATALVDGDLDVCLAGGVDLSIDPFEIIGFAKTGALATTEMRIYDRDSNGFWPGEGSGVVVLMREADARAQGRRIYATITGWGISSDGKGGITRPETEGHRLAIDRAYARAGYGVDTVAYIEGHGTGTALGDATELEVFASVRRAGSRPVAVSSLKGNIGHTKAAAGVGGLIKAALSVHHQVIPPATGHHRPQPPFTGASPAVRVPREAELWPADAPIRAGVSAMGFGGINTHIALEQAPGIVRNATLSPGTTVPVAGRQDAELLLLDAADHAGLRERVAGLVELVPVLSFAETADLAWTLAGQLTGGSVRAAVVVTDPEDALGKLTRLLEALDSATPHLFGADGVFLDHRVAAPRLAYLFPGQGSGNGAIGAIRHRFAAAGAVFEQAALPEGGDQMATQVAQPRIVAGSLAALRVLRTLGIDATTAVGHSLGELTALAWAGALDESEVLRLAGARGEVMARDGLGGGAMAGLAIPADLTEPLLEGTSVTIAGYNGPTQTVIAGAAVEVDRVCARATATGVVANRLNVSHAFHSPLVEPAAVALTQRLADFDFARPTRAVVSSVTGALLAADTDLRRHLHDQVLLPVDFHSAAEAAVAQADLAVEVGPGRVLANLLREIAPDTPVLSVDTDNASLAPLLSVVGAAFALGAPVDTEALFSGRIVRALPLDGGFAFLASPCESDPDLAAGMAGLRTVGALDTAAATTDVAVRHGDGSSTLDLIRELVAERMELPLDKVTADTHPLDDLHLSSITVGQIVTDITRRLDRPPLEMTPSFATVTLGELAQLIDELAETAQDGDGRRDGAAAAGVATWIRPFSVDHVRAPLSAATAEPGPAGSWQVFASTDHPLAERLGAALEGAGLGTGVLLCLPDGGEPHAELMLDAGRAAATAGTRFVVVQGRFGASGLTRTAHLETPGMRTTLVTLADPAPSDAAVDAVVTRVVAEVAATTSFVEVRHDVDGQRTVPALRVVQPPARPTGGTPLDSTDVVLVTGGAKGITAECALVMAKDSGARLALVGQNDAAADEEIAANLARMTAAGVVHRYERADVTDPAQVAAAVARIRDGLGPVTAVVHGAGRNEPTALTALTAERFHQTAAVKVTGLRNVLQAVGPDEVKLLVTFGSIIGRAGLRGEAHYSTANDWMSELTAEFQREHPRARALALEWSLWSGAGMGERLGVVEALVREGITPISLDDGLAVLRQVLADPAIGPVLTISGRMGGLPTLPVDTGQELPLSRFADKVLVHHPDVELVAEVELSPGSDPYLSDHELDGNLLFPAVMGMEAMAQIATAVLGRTSVPLLEDVQFLRPIAIRPGATTSIRLAALVRDSETVDVVIRAEDTSYSADHFRATLRLPRPQLTDDRAERPAVQLPAVPIDPAELYATVLFQGKRFQRLLSYRRASARHAVAELSTTAPAPWFATYLPQDQVLADPGTRDAVMHSIQCCVPNATLLPRSIEKLYLTEPSARDVPFVIMDAQERGQDGDAYTYDIDVLHPSGHVIERWEGLVLRAVRTKDASGPWAPALLGSYIERSVERELGGSRAVVVEPDPVGGHDPQNRRRQTELAASRALGGPVVVRYRPDGKPEVDGGAVSSSHGAGLTLVVAGPDGLGCDVEAVGPRSDADWDALLGAELRDVRRLVAAEAGEDPDVAATRVWCAVECLRKAGSVARTLTVERAGREGWIVLSAGDARIATWATSISGRPDPVVFTVLAADR